MTDDALTCGDKVGTITGRGRHYRSGEDPCDRCKIAYAEYQAARRESNRKKELPEDHYVHGTLNGYTMYGCRCDRCRKANTENRIAGVAGHKAEGLPADSPLHGKYTTYNNYGCRCERCRAATRVARRERRHRQRQK